MEEAKDIAFNILKHSLFEKEKSFFVDPNKHFKSLCADLAKVNHYVEVKDLRKYIFSEFPKFSLNYVICKIYYNKNDFLRNAAGFLGAIKSKQIPEYSQQIPYPIVEGFEEIRKYDFSKNEEIIAFYKRHLNPIYKNIYKITDEDCSLIIKLIENELIYYKGELVFPDNIIKLDEKERQEYLIDLLINKYNAGDLIVADEVVKEITEEEGISRIDLEEIIKINKEKIISKIKIDKLLQGFILGFYANDSLCKGLDQDLDIIKKDVFLYYSYKYFIMKLKFELEDLLDNEEAKTKGSYCDYIFIEILYEYIIKKYRD